MEGYLELVLSDKNKTGPSLDGPVNKEGSEQKLGINSPWQVSYVKDPIQSFYTTST